jgi:transposase-like protein
MARNERKRRKYPDAWSIIRDILEVSATPENNVLLRILEDFVNLVIQVDACIRFGKDPFSHRSKGEVSFNGKRRRTLRTGEGDLEILIPKLRKGSYFPDWLSRWDKLSIGFKSIVANAYYSGVSTRKMGRLFSDLGMDNIDKCMVSRVAKMLDDKIEAWLHKPLQSEYSFIWLDGTYTSVLTEKDDYTEQRYKKSVAVMYAIGIDAAGKREVLHMGIYESESAWSWTQFLEELKERGVERAELWISDDDKGLNKAFSSTYTGQFKQRCIVHWGRNVECYVASNDWYRYRGLVSRIQMSKTSLEFDEYYDSLIALAQRDRNERLVDFLIKSKPDIITYQQFPVEYWSKIKCTNQIERLNRELRAREKDIYLFTTKQSIKQIYGYILMITDTSWSQSSAYLYAPDKSTPVLDYIRSYLKSGHPRKPASKVYAIN